MIPTMQSVGLGAKVNGWGHKWVGASPKTRADNGVIGGFETAEVI